MWERKEGQMESEMPGLEEPPKRPEYMSEMSLLGSAKVIEKL